MLRIASFTKLGGGVACDGGSLELGSVVIGMSDLLIHITAWSIDTLTQQGLNESV
ncbi:hypothetical protein PMIT1323_02472 [Prochlorococcus marinus str. MIT 1323]|nr:hypothetical protein PMIT1323_02472 [Prochlorococcus marinus str. MIT 1323]